MGGGKKEREREGIIGYERISRERGRVHTCSKTPFSKWSLVTQGKRILVLTHVCVASRSLVSRLVSLLSLLV